jgi:hypothetical protein
MVTCPIFVLQEAPSGGAMWKMIEKDEEKYGSSLRMYRGLRRLAAIRTKNTACLTRVEYAQLMIISVREKESDAEITSLICNFWRIFKRWINSFNMTPTVT